MSIPVSKALDTAVNIASLVVILGAGLLLFRRELGRSKPTVALDRPMEYVRDWKAFVSRGNRLGNPRAPLELLELSDYQCPACRSFNGLIHELIAAHPETISLTYLHYPLDYHTSAVAAAVASDCAAQLGALATFHDLLFSQQDSIGRKPFEAFAKESGIRDLAAFRGCVLRSDASVTLRAGRELADRLDFRGTPTVVINGHVYPGIPSRSWLASVIDSVLLAGATLQGRMDQRAMMVDTNGRPRYP